MTSTFTASNRRKESNPIHFAPLFKWLLAAVVISVCGLLFVYVKNQQHILGEQTRGVEREIREVRAQNDVLLARISALTSRTELQRKLGKGQISLVPIQDTSIARLVPPTNERDNVLRTAANERFRQ